MYGKIFILTPCDISLLLVIRVVSFFAFLADLTKESVGFHSKGFLMWGLTVMIEDNETTKDKEST